jgi:hypothetical protein
MDDAGNAQVSGGRTCSVCGAIAGADDGGAVLTWSTSVDEGRRRDVCPNCTRTNVRSIEGKLREEWW